MRNLANLFQTMITSKFRYIVAVFTTALLCAWHAGEAQVLKGSTPAATAQPSAAQLHEHLRTSHGQGRTSPMIVNPHASQLDNSSIIAVCRNQKQNADREVLEIQAALRSMGDGSRGGTGGKTGPSGSQQLTITGSTKGPSGRAAAPAGDIITGNTKGPSGQIGGAGAAGGNNALTITGSTKGPSGQVAAPAGDIITGNAKGPSGQIGGAGGATGNNALTITGNTKGPAGQATAPTGAATGTTAAGLSGNLPAVMRTDTKIAAGSMGGPQIQGPLKTESAGGPQTAGSATSANVIAGPCPQPKIQTISGYPMAVFTPGPLFSPYTIKGCGFGWQMGKVYLTGAFNAGKIPLQVQMTGGSQKAPARASWTDTLIIVSLDPNLSGELDQTNVTLVVEPVSGAPITKPGNDFLAAREVVELATIPQSKVQFTQSAPISKGAIATAPSAVYGPNPPGFQLLYFTPSNIPTGMSAEVFRGGTTVFFPDGYDYYDLHPLAPGFFANTFQLHYDPDPTNCDADTAGSRGSWSATFDSKDNIRVSWKEVRCHQTWMGGYPDVWSEYSLNVFVKGPRGIDPWTGKRLLSAIVPAAVQRAH